jgi:hypothetical protein
MNQNRPQKTNKHNACLPLPEPLAARRRVDDDVLDVAHFPALMDKLALDDERGRADEPAGRGVFVFL